MSDDVLAALRDGPALLADIMQATGRGSSSAYNALAELQATGLVVARVYGPDRSSRRPGRPRNVYALVSYVPPPDQCNGLVDYLFAMHVG